MHLLNKGLCTSSVFNQLLPLCRPAERSFIPREQISCLMKAEPRMNEGSFASSTPPHPIVYHKPSLHPHLPCCYCCYPLRNGNKSLSLWDGSFPFTSESESSGRRHPAFVYTCSNNNIYQCWFME